MQVNSECPHTGTCKVVPIGEKYIYVYLGGASSKNKQNAEGIWGEKNDFEWLTRNDENDLFCQ